MTEPNEPLQATRTVVDMTVEATPLSAKKTEPDRAALIARTSKWEDAQLKYVVECGRRVCVWTPDGAAGAMASDIIALRSQIREIEKRSEIDRQHLECYRAQLEEVLYAFGKYRVTLENPS